MLGTGKTVPKGARVEVHYTGRLEDGKVFDTTRKAGRPVPLSLERVIDGWKLGIPGMKEGGRRKLVIPSDLGYKKEGYAGVIPPDATLVFEVEVVSVK